MVKPLMNITPIPIPSAPMSHGMRGEVTESDGGDLVGSFTAGGAAAVTVPANLPSRLCHVTIITAGTASMFLRDWNTTTTGNGTILLAIPANAPVGTEYNPQRPVSLGILCEGGAGTPGLTFTFA